MEYVGTPPIVFICILLLINYCFFILLQIVAPDAIHLHVKSCRENIKNMHFVAPEYGSKLKVFSVKGF